MISKTQESTSQKTVIYTRKYVTIAYAVYICVVMGHTSRFETKLCNDLTGESTNYLINESMIHMIKESPRNRNVRFRISILYSGGRTFVMM